MVCPRTAMLIAALGAAGCAVQPSSVTLEIQTPVAARTVAGQPEVRLEVIDRRRGAEVAMKVTASPGVAEQLEAAAGDGLRQRGFRVTTALSARRVLFIDVDFAYGHGHYGMIVPWAQNVARVELSGRCRTDDGIAYRQNYTASGATPPVVFHDPSPPAAVLVGHTLGLALSQLLDDERMSACLAGAPP